MRYIIALILCLVFGCASDPVTHGVPNLAEVEPGIWRGGQPSLSGWTYLKGVGVSNVVKLNVESEGSDASAKALGFRVAYIPITTQQQMIGPVRPQLELALKEIHPGTFVHCTHGVNRTGTLIILYRIKVDGWIKPGAIAEADSFGWDSSFHALKDFVEDLK